MKSVLVSMLILVSCSKGKVQLRSETGSQQSANQLEVIPPAKAANIVYGLTPQVKHASLIKNTVDNCLSAPGESLLVIAESAMVQSDKPVIVDGEGRLAFYLPSPRNLYYGADNAFLKNINVVDINIVPLFETDAIKRQDVQSFRADGGYLRALANVADVVAHNCKLETLGESHCDCRTPENSIKIIQRCLPQLDQKDQAEVASALTTQCGGGDKLKARQAIAQFIQSGLFATIK